MHTAAVTENLLVEEVTKSELEIWLSVMSSCVCNPQENSMASTLLPNHTAKMHIVPNVLIGAPTLGKVIR